MITTRKEDVTDNFFGTVVADPYRWLENDTTPVGASLIGRPVKCAI